jgi:hypothetical protein
MSKLLTVISSFLLATVVISTEASQHKEKIKYVHISKYVGCNTTEDFLMSSDMESYIAMYGKGRVFSEYDME